MEGGERRVQWMRRLLWGGTCAWGAVSRVMWQERTSRGPPFLPKMSGLSRVYCAYGASRASTTHEITTTITMNVLRSCGGREGWGRGRAGTGRAADARL